MKVDFVSLRCPTCGSCAEMPPADVRLVYCPHDQARVGWFCHGCDAPVAFPSSPTQVAFLTQYGVVAQRFEDQPPSFTPDELAAFDAWLATL